MRRLKRALLTGTMAVGMLLPSTGALARRHVCKGSIQRGNMTYLMKKSRRSTIVNTPLLEDNRYLSLTLPDRYMKEVKSASAKMPKPKNTQFITRIIQNNVGIALGRLRRSTRTRFYCVNLKAGKQPVARAAPRPAARPASRPATRPRTRPKRVAPRRPATRKPGNKRRRIIFLDEPVRPASPKYSHPYTPVNKGGWGSKDHPYRIVIPVPSQKANGTALYSNLTRSSLNQIGLGTVWFKLQFTSKQGAKRVTSKGKLTEAIYKVVWSIIYKKARAAGKTNFSDSGLRGRIMSIIGAARISPDVKKYVR